MKTLFVVLASALIVCATRADLPPLPQPATSFGAAVADGWLYIYGGNTGKAHEFHRDSIRGEFFRVKLPDGDSWEPLPSDAPLLGAAMAANGGWIYRVGGLQARNAKGEKNDLHSTAVVVRFHPNSQKWEQIAPLPDPRSSHDVAVLGEILYVGGGWKLTGGSTSSAEDSEGEWHKTLLSFDLRAPERGWQSHPQPFERRALAVVAHGDRLWFLGGMGADDEPSREVDWYEPSTGKWGKGPELPDSSMAGFGMAACSANGKLLASPLSGKVYTLSSDGQRWEEATKMARPRFFHRLLPVGDGRLVAVGGSNRQGQIREPELVALDGSQLQATELPASPKSANSSAEAKMPSEPTGNSPWPQWRGPQRDGIIHETGWLKDWPSEGPRLLWKAQVGTGMSSCVLAGGRLFTHGNDGNGNDVVFALDAANGSELWRHSFPCATTAHEMPIVPNGPGATPTVVGGSVFALSREGDLVSLDVVTGKLAWHKHLVKDLSGKRPVYGFSQSPLVDGGRIFLDVGAPQGNDGSTVALDAATGEIAWRAGKGEAGYASARIVERDGRKLVAMFKGEGLDVFDPINGRVLWSHRTTARDFTNATTPALVGHRVLVSNTGTDLAALLDWDTGPESNVRPAWTHKQFALLFNSAIVHEGALFGFNEKRRGHHEFTCIDAQTGETKWVSDAVPTSTFILADNHWIFLTRDGEVILAPATASGIKPSGRFKAVEGKCYATPALANGRLFIRNNEGEVAAFDLRASQVTAKH